MVREVRTLWFREKSFLDDPIITLPLVGDASPRKLIFATLLGAVGYVISLVMGFSGMVSILAVLSGASAGFMIAREPRAVDPMKQLLYALTGSYRPRTIAKPRHIVREVREEVTQVVLSEPVEPVKIHGVVVDPYSGAPLPGAELVLYIDGKPMSKTVTDSQGRYTFYIHLRPGQHIIEVRLGDLILLKKRVIVSVRRPTRS